MTHAARSWLLVPATRTDRFPKAAASGADRLIIDREDAVPPQAKVDAGDGLTAEERPNKFLSLVC